MAAKAKRLVFHAAHPWQAAGYGPYVDQVEIDKPDPELVRLASHAHAAGVLAVSEGLDLSSVQSQQDGETEYQKAVEDGRWREGQEQQHLLEQQAREEGRYGVETSPAENGGEG